MERQAKGNTSETWMPRGEHISNLMATRVGEHIRLSAGRVLISQGEMDPHFYVVLTGKLHVYTLSDDGHEFTFNIMGPGSVVGDAAALSGQPRYSSARVIEDTEVIRLHAAEIEQYIAADAKFVHALLYVLSVKQRQFVGRLQQVLYERPEQRIMRFFNELARTHSSAADSDADPGATGVESTGGAGGRDATLDGCERVTVNLTHEQIGNLTDLSRVTVTRTLNRLKREGAIEFQGRSIVLLRPRT